MVNPSTSSGRILDLRGLRCPLPVLRTRKALGSLPSASVLVVLSDDPLAAVDIPHFLRENGDELVSTEERGAARAFTVRRGERAGGA